MPPIPIIIPTLQAISGAVAAFFAPIIGGLTVAAQNIVGGLISQSAGEAVSHILGSSGDGISSGGSSFSGGSPGGGGGYDHSYVPRPRRSSHYYRR